MKLTEYIYLIGSGAVGCSPPGDCNVYAVESGGETVLIDCGLAPSPEALLRNLRADGLEPGSVKAVLLTHAHPDHAGAVPAFNALGVPVCASSFAARVLAEGMDAAYPMERLEDGPFKDFIRSVPKGRVDERLSGGGKVTVGALSLEVLETPAHSPDSLCFLLRAGERRHLFTGDTLFYPGHISHFAPPLSQAENYPAVIRKLAETEPDGLYPGHALFCAGRGTLSTEAALRAVENGGLPPMKPYS